MWFLRVGDVFDGRYRIERELGTGGMSIVYAAYDEELDETVALKIIKPELVGDADMVERFKREVRIARQLRHDNIIHIYEFGRVEVEDKALYYITMEFLDGVDLATWMRTHDSIPLTESLHTVMQICDALSEAHRLGTVHRDVKPTNIFLDRPGHVKLMDFGVSRLNTLPGLTQGGEFFGTPRYMSPEQVHGRQEMDHRSDIYSLGVVLYELATRRTPFNDETPVRIAIRHLQDIPPRPREIAPELPPSLENVILTCLHKDPRHRYQSAAELRAALELVLREVEASRPGPPADRRPTTVRIAEAEALVEREYWKAFAPSRDGRYVLDRIADAVVKAQVGIESREILGAGLRFHFHGRLGLAGFLNQSVVMTAFPFVREGSVIEVRILDVVSAPASMERWIVGRSGGVKLAFYDALCSTGMPVYRAGDTRPFALNALALAIHRVKPALLPEDLYGVLDPAESGLRKYFPRRQKRFDQGIFQSPVEGAVEWMSWDGLDFARIPVSLGAEDSPIDLFAARELVEGLGGELAQGDEIAGVVWLHGYPPELLPR